MKKIRLFPIILIFCLVLTSFMPSALALDEPNVTSGAVILADADTGAIYYSENADTIMYPASLTKIMTVFLAIEAIERGEVSLTDMVTASSSSQDGMISEGSTANIAIGETMSLKDLLYCAMVTSANEACNIIAEYVGGSVENFLLMMNTRAAELGCTNTHFSNAHGLHADDHYTTASDMLKITAEALNRELFVTMASTTTYTVAATNMSAERVLQNSNSLINASSPYYPNYYYQYASGVKTGYTSNAGYCLASAASKDGVNLIAIVLKGTLTYPTGSAVYSNFTDSIELYDWVFENFSMQEILSADEVIMEVPVAMGDGADSVTLLAKTSVSSLLPNDTDTSYSEFEQNIILYHESDGVELTAPIEVGQALGEITLTKDGEVYGTTMLVASSGVSLLKLEYMKTQISDTLNLFWVKLILWIMIILLVIYGLLVVRYRVLYNRQLEAQRLQRERAQRETELARIKQNSAAAKRPAIKTQIPSEKVVPKPVVEVKEEVKELTKEEKDYFKEFFGD